MLRSQVLAHELIHVFDECRANVDWNNLNHHACSEVRAANLSGDCWWKGELMRGHLNIKVRRAAWTLSSRVATSLGKQTDFFFVPFMLQNGHSLNMAYVCGGEQSYQCPKIPLAHLPRRPRRRLTLCLTRASETRHPLKMCRNHESNKTILSSRDTSHVWLLQLPSLASVDSNPRPSRPNPPGNIPASSGQLLPVSNAVR